MQTRTSSIDSDFSYVTIPSLSPLAAVVALEDAPHDANTALAVFNPPDPSNVFIPLGLSTSGAQMLLPTVDSECSLQMRTDLWMEYSLSSPGRSPSPVRREDSARSACQAPGFILGAHAARAQPARRTRMSRALLDDSDEDAGCGDDALPPFTPSAEQEQKATGGSTQARETRETEPNAPPSSPGPATLAGGSTDDMPGPLAVNLQTRTAPASVSVDNVVAHAASPETDSAVQRAPIYCGHPSDRLHSSHGRRALARLGFKPCEKVRPFMGSTRPETPAHRPHSRVWLESYFSKLPLWFPTSFDASVLSARGIHLEKDGEREFNVLGEETWRWNQAGAHARLYVDPMPGHLRPGGLFAEGPGSPMKLRLGKTTDWRQEEPANNADDHGSAVRGHLDTVEPGEHHGPPRALV